MGTIVSRSLTINVKQLFIHIFHSIKNFKKIWIRINQRVFKQNAIKAYELSFMYRTDLYATRSLFCFRQIIFEPVQVFRRRITSDGGGAEPNKLDTRSQFSGSRIYNCYIYKRYSP